MERQCFVAFLGLRQYWVKREEASTRGSQPKTIRIVVDSLTTAMLSSKSDQANTSAVTPAKRP